MRLPGGALLTARLAHQVRGLYSRWQTSECCISHLGRFQNASLALCFPRKCDVPCVLPGETKIPSLDALAAQLFAQDLHQQCEKALTCQLKSTREGATKDTRIQELADLTKLTRRLLKHVRGHCLCAWGVAMLSVCLLSEQRIIDVLQVLTNSKQFVNVAVTAQRQLEQEIEGLRSANSKSGLQGMLRMESKISLILG